MDDISPNILVETKNEYTHQLTNLIVPHIYEGINSIYDDSKELHNNNNGESTVLKTFQAQLKKVPKWNQEIIDVETQRIVDRAQCDWLSDLITAVFKAHSQILSITTKKDLSNVAEKINVKIPPTGRFIHKCYIECAREFYKNPFLIDKEDLTTVEKQRNMRESLEVIEKCIVNAVRKLLPIQDILRKYIGDDESDDISKSSVITIPAAITRNEIVDGFDSMSLRSVDELQPRQQQQEAEIPKQEGGANPEKKNEEVFVSEKKEEIPPQKKEEVIVVEQKKEEVLPQEKKEVIVVEQKKEDVLPQEKKEDIVVPQKKEDVVIPQKKEEVQEKREENNIKEQDLNIKTIDLSPKKDEVKNIQEHVIKEDLKDVKNIKIDNHPLQVETAREKKPIDTEKILSELIDYSDKKKQDKNNNSKKVIRRKRTIIKRKKLIPDSTSSDTSESTSSDSESSSSDSSIKKRRRRRRLFNDADESREESEED